MTELKEDCYWYYEEQDMGARLPFCKLKKGFDPIEPEECRACSEYHSKYKKTHADYVRSMSDQVLATFIWSALSRAYECGRKGIHFDNDLTETLSWLREEGEI